ncbi:helix-hairpin-helix domain-containing protein [Methylomicrobium sp. Wu6]|uniref:helix-hairpin-helix domain-containing protein n=1 Tax=Methylomicrobium sp. Wu6 TaxID=3107928 RepID=UPI002DD67E4A|nr:helix-hairpin-helix domain-containing protein [Methylomicrobium sp. Wu6]MEC4748675.1 helix-hairpin-helix domain-containing protein [Methylomicrobium sp. Wu6]
MTVATAAKIAAEAQPNMLSDAELLAFLQLCNDSYRRGKPIISDYLYDFVFLEELKKRNPEHSFLRVYPSYAFLTQIEPEKAFAGKTVKLPKLMLSTEKTYSKDGIEKWLQRIEKAAEELGREFSKLIFRATPKLDGYAAYDDGKILYTRGDGRKGTDISRVFERGLIVGGNGKRGQGAGEIVVSKSYFNQHLADFFENARNFQASIIKEKELEEHALAAIQNHAAVFFPFAQLPAWQGSPREILDHFENIIDKVRVKVDYDVDGVIFEVEDDQIKNFMGATRHHHRWQIAYKSNAETAVVKVLRVTPQTSRSGRVNPVAELEPTKLSGAVISRATAHHYKMVREMGIGEGTVIELTRSGEVIPKIERVIIPRTPQIPGVCPSCGTELVWDSDYLYCPNTVQCPAQIENTIEHFFRTLRNIDGFGEKTIEKLHAAGIRSVYQIYQLDAERLQALGFGEKISQNLLDQLLRSRTEPLEDWRFLGAFGIYRMGLGNCERLLQNFPLLAIFDLTLNDIVSIEGFAEKTGEAVISSLAKIKTDFMRIHALGFNLLRTPLRSEQAQSVSPIAGKTIVFTGAMRHGTREDMTREAKRLGAKVGSSVSGKTDFLVTGDDVGAAKINAAQEKGVKVISEAEYLKILK